MKIKTAIGITLLAGFSLFAVGSFAQKSSAQTNTDNTAQNPTMNSSMGQHGMMNGGMMYGGMRQGHMMHGTNMYGRGMMGHNMMGNYSSMEELMHKLASELSAAKAQAGPAVKSKLADAGSLVSKLQDEFSSSWGMMMHNMPMHGNTYCWNHMGQQPQQK